MQKERQPDWQDTNMALFGSDIEKKIKEASADGEVQWEGQGETVGIEVWRIEQFKVRPWSKSKFGRFHVGDSYIVLSTFLKDPENNDKALAWDIHFWIGSKSTADEYGTAAYKVVELDTKLGGEPVQHREVEGHESELFLSYFPSKRLMYLKGGVASGFNHVEAEVREPSLMEVKGKAGNIQLKQVELRRDAMNSGDVFILDCEAGIFQWNGSEANAFERSEAAKFCAELKGSRGGKADVRVIAEADAEDANPSFWQLLPGDKKLLGIKIGEIKVKIAGKGGDDEDVLKWTPKLYLITDGPKYKLVGSGSHINRSKLQRSGVYVFDTGFKLYIWAGNDAAQSVRVAAFPYAQRYLKQYKRPAALPMTQYVQGKEPAAFLRLFEDPEAAKSGCACAIM